MKVNLKKRMKVNLKKIKKVKKKCPNCNKTWDGIECIKCGFDAYCYNPYYD